ncbi:MAG: hypothetical protein A4E41_00658 [Methanoregulaceae archaeon PtaU1.Bin066]|nr:MAG: hypothetical protein A4E41_00658 [Methanoregulaceae archaeon PtaU1.Bin066]
MMTYFDVTRASFSIFAACAASDIESMKRSMTIIIAMSPALPLLTDWVKMVLFGTETSSSAGVWILVERSFISFTSP